MIEDNIKEQEQVTLEDILDAIDKLSKTIVTEYINKPTNKFKQIDQDDLDIENNKS